MRKPVRKTKSRRGRSDVKVVVHSRGGDPNEFFERQRHLLTELDRKDLTREQKDKLLRDFVHAGLHRPELNQGRKHRAYWAAPPRGATISRALTGATAGAVFGGFGGFLGALVGAIIGGVANSLVGAGLVGVAGGASENSHAQK